jgi:hypothetical protein
MNELTDLEFRIIDELYFVTSFNDLTNELGESSAALIQGLRTLLEKELISQLIFEQEQKDYRKLETPDFGSLEHSYFVASKKGLLIHNSRL